MHVSGTALEDWMARGRRHVPCAPAPVSGEDATGGERGHLPRTRGCAAVGDTSVPSRRALVVGGACGVPASTCVWPPKEGAAARARLQTTRVRGLSLCTKSRAGAARGGPRGDSGRDKGEATAACGGSETGRQEDAGPKRGGHVVPSWLCGTPAPGASSRNGPNAPFPRSISPSRPPAPS